MASSSSSAAATQFPILNILNERRKEDGSLKYDKDTCAKIVKLLHAMHKSFNIINHKVGSAPLWRQTL